MLRVIAALVLGAILLPTAAAFAETLDGADKFGASVQTEPLYLGTVNAPQADSVNDVIRDSRDHAPDE